MKRGIEAVRNEKDPAKLEPLAKIVSDPKRPERTARCRTRRPFKHRHVRSRTGSGARSDTSSMMTVRKRAADLLGQLNTDQTRAVLVSALSTAPWDLATSIGGALAKSFDIGAEALLIAIDAGKASPALLRNNAVGGPFRARPQALKDRAAALTKDLPPEDARVSTK